jgi:hypothetical protein
LDEKVQKLVDAHKNGPKMITGDEGYEDHFAEMNEEN